MKVQDVFNNFYNRTTSVNLRHYPMSEVKVPNWYLRLIWRLDIMYTNPSYGLRHLVGHRHSHQTHHNYRSYEAWCNIRSLLLRYCIGRKSSCEFRVAEFVCHGNRTRITLDLNVDTISVIKTKTLPKCVLSVYLSNSLRWRTHILHQVCSVLYVWWDGLRGNLFYGMMIREEYKEIATLRWSRTSSVSCLNLVNILAPIEPARTIRKQAVCV